MATTTDDDALQPEMPFPDDKGGLAPTVGDPTDVDALPKHDGAGSAEDENPNASFPAAEDRPENDKRPHQYPAVKG